MSIQPDASEIQRIWSAENMESWLVKLDDLVNEMKESAEEVQRVADETYSTLNSPSSERVDRFTEVEENTREIFDMRLQVSEERGFQADGRNLDLSVDNPVVSLEQAASVAQSVLDQGFPDQKPQVSLGTSQVSAFLGDN